MGMLEEILEELVEALHNTSCNHIKQVKKGNYSLEVLPQVYLNAFNYAFDAYPVGRVNFKVPDIIYFNSRVIPLDLKRTLKTVKRRNFNRNYSSNKRACLQVSSGNLERIFESPKKYLDKCFEPLLIRKNFNKKLFYTCKYKQMFSQEMKLYDGLIITSFEINSEKEYERKYSEDFVKKRRKLIEMNSIPLPHKYLFLETGSTYKGYMNVLNTLIAPLNEYSKLKSVFEMEIKKSNYEAC